jgi:hypothetical protein
MDQMYKLERVKHGCEDKDNEKILAVEIDKH